MTSDSTSDAPALAPPMGVTSNFVDPYTLTPAFVVTAVLCIFLATSSVFVRLMTDLRGSQSTLRIEDCMLRRCSPTYIPADFEVVTCVTSWVVNMV